MATAASGRGTRSASLAAKTPGVPEMVELFDLDPSAAAVLLADGRPSYLVIDQGAIDGQWAGRTPARTVEAIRASRGLTRIDEAGIWTLYAIGPPEAT
jgi:hypothetical protein